MRNCNCNMNNNNSNIYANTFNQSSAFPTNYLYGHYNEK